MAKLRPAVDAFFDTVKANDDHARARENRMKLLNEIRAVTRAISKRLSGVQHNYHRHSGARQRVRAKRGPMTGSARARNP